MSPSRGRGALAPALATGALALPLALAGWLPARAADHLLLSEVVLTPSPGEYVEIANPTAQAAALDLVHLADTAEYARLPGLTGSGPAPALDARDFIVRFPAGAALPPGGALVVALDGALFFATYGRRADFEIAGSDAATPDMVRVFIGATPGLANGGEGIALFVWDGQQDLVRDLDVVHAGAPALADRISVKTGLAVDGPDADTAATAYAADAGTMPLQQAAPPSGVSTKRIRLEGADEVRGGAGNGIGGDDETTEAIGATWDGGAAGGPSAAFTAPNPGVASFPILTFADDQAPPITPLIAGSADNLIASFQASAALAGGAVTLAALDLVDLGSGSTADIALVSVWHDTLADGALDPATDTRIGQASFAAAQAGVLTIALGGKSAALAAGASERFFLAYDVDAQATLVQGDTFQARIERLLSAPEAAVFGLPLTSAEHNALPELRVTSNQAPDRTADRNEGGVVIADFTVEVTSGACTLFNVEVASSGSGDASVEVLEASLVLDLDQSGSVTAGDTVLDVQSFAAPGGVVTFDANRSLQAGQPERLLVAYAMSALLAHGSVFEVTVDIPQAAVLGATVAGAPLAPIDNATVRGDLDPTLVVTSLSPPDRAVTAGSAGLVVAAFALSAQNAAVGLSDLDATAQGSGNDDQDLARVLLVRDANGSGAFEPLADLVLEVRAYGADDGTLSFDFGGAPVFLQPGDVERFFIVYDLAAVIPEGSTFRLELDNPATTARTVVGLPLASAEVRVVTTPQAQSRGGGGGGGGFCGAVPGGGARGGSDGGGGGLWLVGLAFAIAAARGAGRRAAARPRPAQPAGAPVGAFG